MVISASQVKELRERSGAGIMDCKRALQETNGDLDRAATILKQQGLVKAEKKSGRAVSQGLIEPYIHGVGRIGALVDVNCETDFVARTPDFRELAHDLAMQVAATSPRFVAEDDVPPEVMQDLIVEFGSREEALASVVLLDQPFIKDNKLTIDNLIKDRISRLGENIIVRRFVRFEVGADQPPEPAPGASEGTAP
ncbi:MAG: translation elongation factor Ts [Thermomicrobiales bacterium]